MPDVAGWGIASTVAVVACFLVRVLADVIGRAVLEETKEAVFRRRGFAERRGRHRGLLLVGYFAGVAAATAAFIGLAAATSGVASDGDDAKWLFALAGTLGAGAVGLLTAWWRMAGKPRYC